MSSVVQHCPIGAFVIRIRKAVEALMSGNDISHCYSHSLPTLKGSTNENEDVFHQHSLLCKPSNMIRLKKHMQWSTLSPKYLYDPLLVIA
jgi:hypothetical protein